MNRIIWTAELNARLAAAYLAPGACSNSAAAALGIRRRQAQRQIQRLGLTATLSADELAARHVRNGRVGLEACRATRLASGAVFWTAEMDDRLRTEYVGYGDSSQTIAKRMRLPAKAVARRVTYLGLGDDLTDRQRQDRARDRAGKAWETRHSMAAKSGRFTWTADRVERLRVLYVERNLPSAVCAANLGCAPKTVRRKVMEKGFTALRHAKGLGRKRVARIASELPSVIHLTPGFAAGTTAWEQELHTAGPPRPVNDNNKAVSLRAIRKAQLARAAKGHKIA